ncbi:RnfABCDGE type electron transport complex subunit B [Aminipila luticellarii]|uniref:Ion-translocating oxidoreductase complex subunit B n=1 Tax=Aminipila luticellarii TaxID=2507160 RepID=A0A410PYL0_9FIRM|nr:RnfABCDGE type electron transport complex subunit B [Aminipila luticellarii]QAT43940.1 RnfABCDGE type electron transport complex subunit B [Aminipila luticellarii]
MMTPVILLVVMGLVAGIVLTIASKVFFVPVDETVSQVREVLPGANCGACGFAGCDDYAAAIGADHSLSPSLCPVGGAETASAVASILGVEAAAVEPQVAFVKCKGNNENTKQIMEYKGLQTCAAAKNFYGGNWACAQGCLGLGDCVSVCQYNAIKVCDGVAVVDREACIGCGMCEKACPNHVITIAGKNKLVYVACKSTEPGAKARKICQVACIACKKCEKACKFDAIAVTDNLARIDFDKCRNCGLCEKECPTQAISNLRVQKKTAAAQ